MTLWMQGLGAEALRDRNNNASPYTGHIIMKVKITKCSSVTASQLRDFMLIDFDDGEPGMTTNVRHLAHKVLFTARNTEFSADKDEIFCAVQRMTIAD